MYRTHRKRTTFVQRAVVSPFNFHCAALKPINYNSAGNESSAHGNFVEGAVAVIASKSRACLKSFPRYRTTNVPVQSTQCCGLKSSVEIMGAMDF